MPIFDQTTLNATDKLDFLLKAAACQAHGDISRVSFEFNVSRKTVRKAKVVGLALFEDLLDQTDTVQQVNVDEPQIRRTIVAMSITAPCSIRAIEDLLPIIYPGVTRSFGYIQALQIQAQLNAAAFNRQVDLSAIVSIAIDEVFCQNEPVLAGIDLDSGFLPSLSLEEFRDGKTWGRVLNEAKAQGMVPWHIVKDGATGMAKGVRDSFPNAEQRDDAFHALYITSKAVNKVEKRAYRLIIKEEIQQKALCKAKEDEKEKLNQSLGSAIAKCNEAIEQYELAEKSLNHLHHALRSVHSTNEIAFMSPQAAQSLLTLSAHLLEEADHPDCDDAARYIRNRLEGLTLATADFYQKQLILCQDYPEELVALACYFFEYKRTLKKMKPEIQQHAHQKMLAAYHYIRSHLNGSKVDELMLEVERLLSRRHRASSAVEGFNALLRPYMYVRKGVSQGFLELFKAWHNLRTRRSGKHKGTSAYETLTGTKVDDWLTLIGFPPSGLLH
jgi:hypothetical protein